MNIPASVTLIFRVVTGEKNTDLEYSFFDTAAQQLISYVQGQESEGEQFLAARQAYLEIVSIQDDPLNEVYTEETLARIPYGCIVRYLKDNRLLKWGTVTALEDSAWWMHIVRIIKVCSVADE
jgi:hypothetical protein